MGTQPINEIIDSGYAKGWHLARLGTNEVLESQFLGENKPNNYERKSGWALVYYQYGWWYWQDPKTPI